MFNKKILLILATGTASIACAFSVMFANDNIFTLSSYEQPYGITFNSSKNKFFSGGETTGYNGQATVITNNKNDIEFEYNSLSGGSSSSVWHIIKAGGYFYNLDPIHGLESVSIKCAESDKEYRVLWGFDCNFTLGSSVLSSSTSGLLCNFNNDSPTYFKVENISEDVFSIVNMDISLDCTNYYPVLTVLSDDEEKGTVSGGGIKHVGDSVTITASANSGYSFNGWYKGTSLLSNENPYTFTMPSVDTKIRAEFLTGETLLLDSNFEGDAVTVTGGGIYDLNEQVTISAEAIDELVFDGWYDRDYNLVSNSNPYTFQFTESADLVAYYHYSSFTFTFTEIDTALKTCLLSGYSGNITNDVYIPKLYEGNSVVSIGERAFENNYYIRSLFVSSSVETIGNRAFYQCSNLSYAKVGDSVTSIGDFAFCLSPLQTVILGEYVNTIGNYAFRDCDLISIVIPHNVTSIGNDAFFNCVKLIEVVNKSSLDIVAGSTNNGMVAYYANQVIANEKDSKLHFDSDGFVNYVTEDDICLIDYRGNCTSITIPDYVTSIGIGAFDYCTFITSITIPDSVTSIGANAFMSCTRLASITLPSGIKSIESGTFQSCNSLTSIIIPDSVESIGGSAFSHCYSLTSITIPNSVDIINDLTFYYCESLTSVIIPNHVKTIGSNAFSHCYSLTSIIIPDTVESIGSNAFSYCYSLTYMTLGSKVTTISNNAFQFCLRLVEIVNKSALNIVAGQTDYGSIALYAKQVISNEIESKINVDSNGFVTYFDGFEVSLVNYFGNNSSIILPNNVTSIGAYALFNHLWLSSLDSHYFITSVTIPNTVTSIGSYAFSNCSSLSYVAIGKMVSSIGVNAFKGCSSLSSIIIPYNVTSIYDNAFSECYSITINCEIEEKPIGWSENWNPDNRPVVWGYLES